MKNLIQLLAVSCISLFAFAGEMQKPDADIVVSCVDSSHIVVKVNRGSNVEAVLRAFCAEAKFDCEITPSAGQTGIAPMTISGTWEQVVGKLVEGTNLNYVGTPGDKSGHGGRLLVQMGSGAPISPAPAANIPTVAPPEQSESVSPQQNNSDLNQTESTQQMTADADRGSVEPPAGMALTPFAGPHGRPLMVAVEPVDPRVTPFVGPDGKPVMAPVTGARPDFLPFVDEHGQPIPMPPPAPSGAVPSTNPFPPTRSH
jgi:hypothetical protein